MDHYQKICTIDELPNRKGRKFIIDDIEIAVFKINGKVYAVSNTCPHNQSKFMYDGYVDENLYLSCPIHGWQFHLETGKTPPECKELSSKLETYNIKIINNELWVEVKRTKKKWFNF